MIQFYNDIQIRIIDFLKEDPAETAEGLLGKLIVSQVILPPVNQCLPTNYQLFKIRARKKMYTWEEVESQLTPRINSFLLQDRTNKIRLIVKAFLSFCFGTFNGNAVLGAYPILNALWQEVLAQRLPSRSEMRRRQIAHQFTLKELPKILPFIPLSETAIQQHPLLVFLNSPTWDEPDRIGFTEHFLKLSIEEKTSIEAVFKLFIGASRQIRSRLSAVCVYLPRGNSLSVSAMVLDQLLEAMRTADPNKHHEFIPFLKKATETSAWQRPEVAVALQNIIRISSLKWPLLTLLAPIATDPIQQEVMGSMLAILNSVQFNSWGDALRILSLLPKEEGIQRGLMALFEWFLNEPINTLKTSATGQIKTLPNVRALILEIIPGLELHKNHQAAIWHTLFTLWNDGVKHNKVGEFYNIATVIAYEDRMQKRIPAMHQALALFIMSYPFDDIPQLVKKISDPKKAERFARKMLMAAINNSQFFAGNVSSLWNSLPSSRGLFHELLMMLTRYKGDWVYTNLLNLFEHISFKRPDLLPPLEEISLDWENGNLEQIVLTACFLVHSYPNEIVRLFVKSVLKSKIHFNEKTAVLSQILHNQSVFEQVINSLPQARYLQKLVIFTALRDVTFSNATNRDMVRDIFLEKLTNQRPSILKAALSGLIAIGVDKQRTQNHFPALKALLHHSDPSIYLKACELLTQLPLTKAHATEIKSLLHALMRQNDPTKMSIYTFNLLFSVNKKLNHWKELLVILLSMAKKGHTITLREHALEKLCELLYSLGDNAHAAITFSIPPLLETLKIEPISANQLKILKIFATFNIHSKKQADPLVQDLLAYLKDNIHLFGPICAALINKKISDACYLLVVDTLFKYLPNNDNACRDLITYLRAVSDPSISSTRLALLKAFLEIHSPKVSTFLVSCQQQFANFREECKQKLIESHFCYVKQTPQSTPNMKLRSQRP